MFIGTLCNMSINTSISRYMVEPLWDSGVHTMVVARRHEGYNIDNRNILASSNTRVAPSPKKVNRTTSSASPTDVGVYLKRKL